MRVLVVDDDPDFQLLCRRALVQRGHHVDVTSSAFGLVNRASVEPPDVILLDVDLPGLSGFAAIELLKKDRRTQLVPIVLVSAADSDQHYAAASAHGRALFLKKDGRMLKMCERVEQHVDEMRALVAPATAEDDRASSSKS